MLILTSVFIGLFIYGLFIGKLLGALMALGCAIATVWAVSAMKSAPVVPAEKQARVPCTTEMRLHKHDTEASSRRM
jgi:hypothetical protein